VLYSVIQMSARSAKNRIYKYTTNVLYALTIYIYIYTYIYTIYTHIYIYIYICIVRDERCTENKSSKLTQTNMCLHRQRDNANGSQQMST